ncbi:MAG: YodC family protein [Ottowia sp.]|nr:YodC family protein [Ottowia sp.]
MLKVGDTVRLKSSGPLMTVNAIDNDSIKCQWFDGNNSLQEGVFHKDQLEVEI